MTVSAEATLQRRFCVHEAGEARNHGRIVEGVSFEDAALHFVADEHPAVDADDEVSLYVEDVESGERQCFRIDVGTGQTAPCD